MLFILIYRKNIDRILQVHHPQSGVMDRNQAIGLVVGPCIAISVTLKYYKCALFILDQLRKLIGKIIIHKPVRSEEHTSELQSRGHLVCRLLLEKKDVVNYWDDE